MYIARFLAGFVVSTGLVVSAALACEGRIDVDSRLVATGYSPFDPADKQNIVPVSVENTSEERCRFGIGFDYSPNGGQLGGQLSYQLAYEGRSLLDSPANDSSPDLMLDVEAGERRTLDLKFVVSRGQFVTPGDYKDSLKLSLFSVSDGNFIELSERDVVLVQRVAPDFSISIAGAGQKTTLDFGVLTQGASRDVKLSARSNTDYKLIVASDNDGKLRLTPQVSGKDWTVDYSAKLDSSTLDLQRDQWSTSALAVAAGGLVKHNLEVTIGATDAKRAGTYKDVLTIVIEAATP